MALSDGKDSRSKYNLQARTDLQEGEKGRFITSEGFQLLIAWPARFILECIS